MLRDQKDTPPLTHRGTEALNRSHSSTEHLDSHGAIANVEQAGLAYTLYDTPAGTRQSCALCVLPRLVVAKVFTLQAALSRYSSCSITALIW